MRSTRWTQCECDRLSVATTARAATALLVFAVIQSCGARGIRGLDVRGGQAEAATLEDGPADDHTTTMNATGGTVEQNNCEFQIWYPSESIVNPQFQLLSEESAFFRERSHPLPLLALTGCPIL